jgi:hypothetical protein
MLEDRAHLSGRIGALKRHHGPNHPEIVKLRRELSAQRVADFTRKVSDAGDYGQIITRAATLLEPGQAGGAA